MKKILHLIAGMAILIALGTQAGCKKTSDNSYILECKKVEGTSQITRNENCKKCCKDNGWDNGVYWELAAGGNEPGCECFND